MNEVTRLLTDEQTQYLDKLAMRFKMSLEEVIVVATLTYFDGSFIDDEFDEYFLDDRRRYILEHHTPDDMLL